MNKAGILSGCIMVPFLLTLFFPWGKSLLGLYLFNDNGKFIGVFGVAHFKFQVLTINNWIFTWWFTLTALNLNTILVGVVFYVFPLVSCILCFAGANRAPEKGKKYYITAFFLLLVAIVLLITDALFLGALVVSRIYTIVEFFSGINIGFYIYVFDMILMMFAGLTYKET